MHSSTVGITPTHKFQGLNIPISASMVPQATVVIYLLYHNRLASDSYSFTVTDDCAQEV